MFKPKENQKNLRDQQGLDTYVLVRKQALPTLLYIIASQGLHHACRFEPNSLEASCGGCMRSVQQPVPEHPMTAC